MSVSLLNLGDDSPWGAITLLRPWRDEIIGGKPEGVWWVGTDSHAGYYFSPHFNERVPLAVREGSFCGQGLSGWYEEDCDAADVEPYRPGRDETLAGSELLADAIEGGARDLDAEIPF